MPVLPSEKMIGGMSDEGKSKSLVRDGLPVSRCGVRYYRDFEVRSLVFTYTLSEVVL